MRQVGLRAFAVLILAVSGACWPAPASRAQDWHAKSIRIIVPFPPGGTTDQIARRVQPFLEQDLKTTIVIENRGGASGAIGTQAAALSPPDGTTFLLVFDTHAVNPSLLPNLPFDTLKDLAPIMLIGTSPMVITAHPATSYKSFEDVIAAARKTPGSVAYGTIGVGQPRAPRDDPDREQARRDDDARSLQGRRAAGDRRYRRACPARDRIDRAVVAADSRWRAAAVGRDISQALRAIAGHAGVAETRRPGFDADSWWGLLAPAKTPSGIIGRMNAAMGKALQDPRFSKACPSRALSTSFDAGSFRSVP